MSDIDDLLAAFHAMGVSAARRGIAALTMTPDAEEWAEQSRLRIRPGVDFAKTMTLNMYGCDRAVLDEPEVLKLIVARTVERLDMKAYGEPFCERFGLEKPWTSGWTVIQPIETSILFVHTREDVDQAYFTVQSCKDYDVDPVTVFLAAALGAERVVRRVFIDE